MNTLIFNYIFNATDSEQFRLKKTLILIKPTEVVLSVKDYGIGIPEEEQMHVFEPFFRAENVTEIKGTGLGLSIAKEYVEVNKGTITATSILGEGSCFGIIFKKELL